MSLHSLAGPTAVTAGPSPTALTFAPPLPYFAQSSADTLLLVADEAHKLRIYNADTHTCVSTAVGPLHGGYITSCRVFRWVCESNSAFCVKPPWSIFSIATLTVRTTQQLAQYDQLSPQGFKAGS